MLIFGCRNLWLCRRHLINRANTTDMAFLNFYICFSRSNRFSGDKNSEWKMNEKPQAIEESCAELKSGRVALQLAGPVVFEMIPPNLDLKNSIIQWNGNFLRARLEYKM